MKEKKVFLTVIIPSYNHENYIENCLSEVIKIDIPKVVIIIDDGSSDKTPFIIKQFIENNKNENIEFIEKENSGLISSLNIGLNKTKTEFIYMIASDDIVIPEGIKNALDYLISKPNIDFLLAGGYNFFGNGRKTLIYKETHLNFFNMPFKDRYTKLFLDFPSPILIQASIFRTNILKKNNGFDAELEHDDFPLFIKLLSNSKNIYEFIPEIKVVLYRHHGDNSYKKIFRQYSIVLETLKKLTPLSLKNKAIGNSLGHYTLKALQQMDLKAVCKMLYISSIRTYFYAIIRVFNIIYKKIIKKK